MCTNDCIAGAWVYCVVRAAYCAVLIRPDQRLHYVPRCEASSPGSSTGVSAMKAQWRKRASFRMRRKAATPIVSPRRYAHAGPAWRPRGAFFASFICHTRTVSNPMSRSICATVSSNPPLVTYVISGDVAVACVQACAHGRKPGVDCSTSSPTCSKLDPSENSAPAVFRSGRGNRTPATPGH